jgi:predicted nicotinamide N-methyase
MIGGAQSGPPALEIIRTGTQLRSVPLVPQIRLHQASDPISLWQRTELAAGRTGLDPPFWAFAWAGGQALARYLLDHPEAVRGQQVIDIASGSGLVAIAAAQAGAAAVTAYDIDPLAAAAIAMNAAANGVAVLAVCADVLDQDDPPSPGTDLVLAGDAFYERGLAARVMRFLERGHTRGTAVLAGDCGRAYLPRNRLTPLATYDVPGRAAGDTPAHDHALTPRPRPLITGRGLDRHRPARDPGQRRHIGAHRQPASGRHSGSAPNRAPRTPAVEEPLDLIGAAELAGR